MGRGAEAVDAQAPEVLAAHPVRAVADQAGTQEGRRLGVRVVLREAEAVVLVGNGVVGKATVDRVAGEAGTVAQVLSPRRAVRARTAGGAEPGHADPLPVLEPIHTLAGRGHRADDLVPGHDGQPGVGKLVVHQVEIGATHAARPHPDQHLAGVWSGNLAVA